MITFKKITFTLGLCLSLSIVSFAQESLNENALRPVPKNDQLVKKTLWLRMDGSEKQNRQYFANGNEITKIIIDAVKAGIIRPFENDSLRNRMTYDQFISNLTVPASGEITNPEDEWETEPQAETDSSRSVQPAPNLQAKGFEYFAKDLTILEIRENLVFDKKRSRMVHEMESITIKIPAKLHPAGLEMPLATFSFKELVENVFKDNPQAIGYNNDNQAEHRNFGEAFEVRDFSAHLFKYANWDDATVADMNGGEGKAAIVAAQQIEYEMLDFEQDTWEN
jgi:gliding motility associated protien GldN